MMLIWTREAAAGQSNTPFGPKVTCKAYMRSEVEREAEGSVAGHDINIAEHQKAKQVMTQ